MDQQKDEDWPCIAEYKEDGVLESQWKTKVFSRGKLDQILLIDSVRKELRNDIGFGDTKAIGELDKDDFVKK